MFMKLSKVKFQDGWCAEMLSILSMHNTLHLVFISGIKAISTNQLLDVVKVLNFLNFYFKLNGNSHFCVPYYSAICFRAKIKEINSNLKLSDVQIVRPIEMDVRFEIPSSNQPPVQMSLLKFRPQKYARSEFPTIDTLRLR